jgi:hypothetical protein
MTDTTSTRKAVVTTEVVREAFSRYLKNYELIGLDVTGHEFDRGRKGFAEYNNEGGVVRQFDTKESALLFYGLMADGMDIVLNSPNVTVKSDETAPEAPKPATRKAPVKATENAAA